MDKKRSTGPAKSLLSLPPCVTFLAKCSSECVKGRKAKGFSTSCSWTCPRVSACLLMHVCIHSQFVFRLLIHNVIAGGEGLGKEAHSPHFLPVLTSSRHLPEEPTAVKGQAGLGFSTSVGFFLNEIDKSR